jgi:small subunit ribosomal protein S15
MLNKDQKKKIIAKFKTHENDTGSSQVQIAILTEEVKRLTEHLKSHKHDHSSRRGLLRKVGERRRLLKYLQKEDEKSFAELAKKLKLKIAKKMIEDEELEKIRLEEAMRDRHDKSSADEESAEDKTSDEDEE